MFALPDLEKQGLESQDSLVNDKKIVIESLGSNHGMAPKKGVDHVRWDKGQSVDRGMISKDIAKIWWITMI